MKKPKGDNAVKGVDSLSDSALKFIDELPDPRKPEATCFPYGSDKVRPYGWHLK